jgi:hypothetical protein
LTSPAGSDIHTLLEEQDCSMREGSEMTLGRVREETLRRAGARLRRHGATALAVAGMLLCAGGPLASVARGEGPQWYSNNNKVSTEPGVPVLISSGELKIESPYLGPIKCPGSMINGSVWNESGRGVGREEGWGTDGPCTAETLQGLYCERPFGRQCNAYVTTEMPLENRLRQGEVCLEEKKLSECTNREIQELAWKTHRRVSSFPSKLEAVNQTIESLEEHFIQLGLPETATTCYPTEKVVVEGKEIERAASWQKVSPGCIKLNIIDPGIPLEAAFYGTLEPKVLNGIVNGLHPTGLEFGVAAGGLAMSEGELNSRTPLLGTAHLMGSEALQLITAK